MANFDVSIFVIMLLNHKCLFSVVQFNYITTYFLRAVIHQRRPSMKILKKKEVH